VKEIGVDCICLRGARNCTLLVPSVNLIIFVGFSFAFVGIEVWRQKRPGF
jgi:hypothetical protein